MGMTIPVTVTEAEVEQITKKKLMEDLKTVVADAEELLKKAASEQTREWIGTAQAKAKKSLKAANDWLARGRSSDDGQGQGDGAGHRGLRTGQYLDGPGNGCYGRLIRRYFGCTTGAVRHRGGE